MIVLSLHVTIRREYSEDRRRSVQYCSAVTKAYGSYYQLLLECSSFVRLTPKTLVTNALNSSVDELRI